MVGFDLFPRLAGFFGISVQTRPPSIVRTVQRDRPENYRTFRLMIWPLRRSIHHVLIVITVSASALGPVPGEAGTSDTLVSTRYGAVDFGDRITYRVDGVDCELARPHVAVTTSDGVIEGPASEPRPDGIDPSGCTGAANVPSFSDVASAGWTQGEPISIELRSVDEVVPLRYFRIEADQGTVAAGAPVIGRANDQDTGAADNAMTMGPGDSVSLGRVDLDRVEAMSLRLCITGSEGLTTYAPGTPVIGYIGGSSRIEPPVILSIRQGSATGPALIGPIDVSSNPTTLPRLSTEGFHGCYRLVHLPITSRSVSKAPELFVTVDAAIPGVLQLNSVDIVGTAAKIPAPRETDPPGMQTVFDGASWAGWTQAGCQLNDDGSASNLRTGSDVEVTACLMTYETPLQNAVIRLDLRRRDFLDNGGILVGQAFPQQIQLRSAGEYGPGGYNGQYAARALKLNSWPDWSHMEIVQLGARYVVTINGRTVTDFTRADGAPAPYRLGIQTEPEWSFRAGASNGFGNEVAADITKPSEWGDYWFRNIRVLECEGADDPACLQRANANAGQVPQK